MPVPNSGRVETWTIQGWTYLVQIWSHAQWDRLPHSDRPVRAFVFGGLGWVYLQPVGEAPALGELDG